MKKNYYVGATLALLLLAGCNDDTDVKFANDSGVKVTFSAVINDPNANNLSRVTGVAFEDGDSLGITCGPTQVNIKYRYNAADQSFTAANAYNEVWLIGNDEYAVSAYYPYKGDEDVAPMVQTVMTTSEFQQTAEAREGIDYLYASGTANRWNPNVQLAFRHAMSRLVLKFKPGKDYQGNPITLSDVDFYISGLNLYGTFNPNTGETALTPLSVDESGAVIEDPSREKSIYQQLDETNDFTFTGIFLPQTVDGNNEFRGVLLEGAMRTGDSRSYYSVTLGTDVLPELLAGYSYEYELTANAYNDNEIKLDLSGVQINPWNSVDGGTFEPTPGVVGTDANATSSTWGDMEQVDVEATPVE